MTDVIFALLRKEGKIDYIGENVTQIEHMLEAGQMALEREYPNFVVVAALLHDVGHLLPGEKMGYLGITNHEKLGANYLRNLGFQEKVCDLIENHVNAKRYLVTLDKDYMLSEASKQTLEYQGGKMSLEEFQKFEQSKNFLWYLRLREIDEAAKGNKLATMTLEDFRSRCNECISV